MDKSRPVVILGMPWSGGSSVAGALSKLGVFFGEEAECFQTEEGRFEQKALTSFNLRCLTAFQMHVASTVALPLTWRSYPEAVAFRNELKVFLAEKFLGRDRWGIYQPTASLIAPLYRGVFLELGLSPHCVVCVRNPAGIDKRPLRWSHGASPALGPVAIGAWLSYTIGALKAAREGDFTVAVEDEFVKAPKDFLERIVDWTVSEDQWSRALAGIACETPVEESLDEYPELVREILSVCRSSGDKGRLASLIEEFEVWQAMLALPGPPGTQFGLAWSERGFVQVSQVPFLPTSDWQTVRLPITAPTNTALSGLIYGQPCRVWIRHCVWLAEGVSTPAKFVSGPGSHLVEIDGLVRLDGAYESQQISIATPSTLGPYELEIEFLLEAGPQINVETANRLSNRLQRCNARYQALASSQAGGR